VSTPLPQCDAFYYIYNQQGDVAPGVLVTLKEVIDAGGSSILLSPLTTLTDPAGSFHFTLPEDAQVNIAARATGLWNCPEGRWFKVPPGPSGELIPDFTLPPSTTVEPPLIYLDGVLSIPKATATQDGYLSAADYVAFLAGATSDMGVVSFNTRTGEVMLLSNDVIFALGYVPINKDGDTMNGPLVLPGNPTLGSQAANKAYVDANRIQSIPGVAGTYPNPSSITVNAQGQIIAITRGTPDTTPPVISAVSVISITATGATITWTTDEPADSQVEYGPTTAYGASSTLDSSPVTTHSVTIIGLAASALYHYRVKSRDTASNLATSGDFTFTTTAAPDTTPPVISAVASSGLTATGATITWTTDEPGDSQVEYGPTTAYGSLSTINPSLLTSHSVPITGLTASTLYHYRVKSRDAASNLAISTDFTFTTTAGPDVTPPVVSAVASSSITGTGATITWATDEASDSQVEYGTTTSYGSSTVLDPSMVTSHNVTISSLTPSMFYHYRVKSKDAAGNPATSADFTFTTTALMDPTVGLVSYWTMDETSGTRADTKTLNPLAVGSAPVGAIAGLPGLGNAADSPGNNTFLSGPDSPSLRFTGSMSIVGWMKIHATSPQYHTLLAKIGTGTDCNWIVWYRSDTHQWDFIVSADGNLPGVTATVPNLTPTLETWHHIAAVFNMSTGQIQLKIDDGAVGSDTKTFAGPIFGSAANMSSLLTYIDSALWGNCAVEEVGIWDRALSDAEITYLFNAGSGRTYPFS
jgi:hypothetical protein